MKFVIKHNAPSVAEALRRRGAAAIADIDSALQRGAMEVARESIRTMPKFRSTTAAATGVEHVGPLEWMVRFGTHYAKYTEGGSGPGGWVPTLEMMDWLRMKRIQPRTKGMSLAELAQLIQWSILRKGVREQPFAQPALEKMTPRLVELVTAAAARHLSDGGAEGAPA